MSTSDTSTGSSGRSAQLLIRLFLVSTLVGSGGYVLLYLYRWEWNRALISGLFFLASEIALFAGALSGRLRRLEGNVERALEQARFDAARDGLVATRPAAPEHFAWLQPTVTRMGVFVPVLMGAGVVLSAIAWLVERLARVTARPALEQRLARRLGALTLVARDGGFVPSRTAAPGLVPVVLRPGRR